MVTVRLFARAKDVVGRDSVRVELAAGATVGELRRRLAAEYPALAGLLARSAIGIDSEFARDEAVIPAAAEVALLPPVSGG
jgi:molybdopterin synthase catalytic subunit